jgi:hypothetical protein
VQTPNVSKKVQNIIPLFGIVLLREFAIVESTHLFQIVYSQFVQTSVCFPHCVASLLLLHASNTLPDAAFNITATILLKYKTTNGNAIQEFFHFRVF